MEINFITGDATSPVGNGNRIVAHVCNDIGVWGKGFVMVLSGKWPITKMKLIESFKAGPRMVLGDIQPIKVAPSIWVVNMVGQHGIASTRSKLKEPPVRYQAIGIALCKLAIFASENNASVHLPRIGCGLAGGTWDKIQPLIEEAFSGTGIVVTVYDFI